MADRTHLHRAAQRGDIGAVRALVQAVDVNIRGGWRVESPLHAASRAGRPDVIACLMEAGAHTEVRDRNNDTPLLLAAWLGHATAVAKLLTAGARVDAYGIPRSALHCACMQGHADCVAELLRGGADEESLDEDGNTPSQVVGTMSESLERAENTVVIHAMLRHAPADRVWRRRGWLVMLRARDCAAAVLLPLSSPPLAVTTRGAARRAVEFDRDGGITQWSQVRPSMMSLRGEQKSLVQPPKEIVTRRSRGGRAVGGEKVGKMAKRSSGGGVGSVRASKGKHSSRKRGGQHKGKGSGARGARGGVITREERDAVERQVLTNLVASLTGLGEEGAFRCVLSFL